MGLNIWFSEDIRNALLAADEASGQMAAMVAMLEPRPEPRELRAFRDGFKAALVTSRRPWSPWLWLLGWHPRRSIGRPLLKSVMGNEIDIRLGLDRGRSGGHDSSLLDHDQLAMV